MSILEEWEVVEMIYKERQRFEEWLLEEQGLDADFDEKRNCYCEFAIHLAWRAWCAN